MTTETTTIKTFEDACSKLGRNPNDLPDFSMMPEKHRKALTSHCKLIIVRDALVEEWEANWNDPNQAKFYPWFEIKATKKQPAGVGFSGTLYDVWFTYTSVGSRLCFPTREMALYVGKQFAELYKDYFLFN